MYSLVPTPDVSTMKYYLVRWIAEESIGIMPSSSLHNEDNEAVGAVVRLKWSSKQYYDAEILKISGKIFPLYSS